MSHIKLTAARLRLPRLLNGVELSKGAGPHVDFDLGDATVKQIDLPKAMEIAIGLIEDGKNNNFACLFLDVQSAKDLADKILEQVNATNVP